MAALAETTDSDHEVFSSNHQFPLISCGMFQIKNSCDVMKVLDEALACGYRAFDTAAVYKNEAIMGNILPDLLSKHGLHRENIFITTKLGPKDHGAKAAVDALDRSLLNLKLNYVDLYLIHWPGKQGIKQNDPSNKKLRHDTWVALVGIQKNSRKIKHLGVSNYTHRHLLEMTEYGTALPAVVQNEFHPDYQEHDVFDFCKKHNVHFQAYSSLGASHLVLDERFSKFAQKYQKSIPQVLLRWSIQRGCSVIPKSISPNHIKENIDIFHNFNIEPEDMIAISKSGKNIKYCWDSKNVF